MRIENRSSEKVINQRGRMEKCLGNDVAAERKGCEGGRERQWSDGAGVGVGDGDGRKPITKNRFGTADIQG